MMRVKFLCVFFFMADALLMASQQIDAGDMETLDTLLPANAGVRKTLADVIFSKLESSQIGDPTVIQKSYQSKFYCFPTKNSV